MQLCTRKLTQSLERCPYISEIEESVNVKAIEAPKQVI